MAMGDRFEKLAEEIKKFLVSNKGRATTNDILTKFKVYFQLFFNFIFITE